MSQVNNPPPRDPRVVFHESLFAGEDEPLVDDAEVTRQLRSLGRILDPVSAEQRQQLDTIAAMRPAKKRRKKKSERKAKK